jgi:hypothetical protein
MTDPIATTDHVESVIATTPQTTWAAAIARKMRDNVG